MSQRRQIVLPDPVDQQLCELAASADTPPSTLAAHIVAAGVAQAAKDGKVRPLRPAPALAGTRGEERPPWLEPYGGDTEWRRQMWGQVVALHGRYPLQLGALKDKWWSEESTTETLCALAVWRAELDDAGVDPRDELAFQSQLADYSSSCASRAAASPRHGNPAPHPPSGLRRRPRAGLVAAGLLAGFAVGQWLAVAVRIGARAWHDCVCAGVGAVCEGEARRELEPVVGALLG